MNAITTLEQNLIPFLEDFPWPIALIDILGHVIFFNEEMKSAVVGTDLEFAKLLPEYFFALKGEPNWRVSQKAEISRQKNGRILHEQLWLRSYANVSYLIALDQTKLRHLESGNAQTARLATLGFMLAGVCHEISNPLTAINSMVQILRSGRGITPAAIEKGLENIADNVKRVLEISRKLNDFSRKGEEDRRTIQIDTVIEDALTFSRQDPWFIKVQVEHRVDPEAIVLGNPSELRQVFFNIIINALHAMNGQGRLSIHTSQVAKQVVVKITDTGPGIADENLPKLFEPFFTTKACGAGTGLGLAISNEIILENSGSIEAENNFPNGARFIVRLPLYEREVLKR